jgi:flagellar basal-body rod protein FlgB
MFIDGLVNSDAIPVLEMTARFAGRRQDLIAHNIANLETPNFRPMDVSTRGFQRLLGEAIDRRREKGRPGQELEWRESKEVLRADGGPYALRLSPRTSSENVLSHDRNNSDLERTMQALAENTGVFRVATDLLRSRYLMLNAALAERVA